MKKIRLTEQDLKRIIKESVRRALLKEDDDYTIQYAVDKCANIIASTQCAGRNFDFKGKSTLDGDEKYNQLKEQLISAMEAYFNAAKEMMSFLADTYGNDHIREKASRFLSKEFSPA